MKNFYNKINLVLMIILMFSGTIFSQTEFSVSGNFNYNNTVQTALSDVTVKLMNGSTEIASTITNVLGEYLFVNIPNGTYNIVATTSKLWSGVTATDALKIKRHVAWLELLTEPVKKTAADPNNTGYVNATDVLTVQRRIASLDVSFTRGNWIFEIPNTGGNTVIVNGGNVNQNFYGLCVGDVNGSYVPVF